MNPINLVRTYSKVTLNDVYNDIIDLVEDGCVVRVTPHSRFNRMALQTYSDYQRGVKLAIRTIDGFYYAMKQEAGKEFKKRRSPGEYSNVFSVEGLSGVYDPTTQENPSTIVFEKVAIEDFRRYFNDRTPTPTLPSTANNIADYLLSGDKTEIAIPLKALSQTHLYSSTKSIPVHLEKYYPGQFKVTVDGASFIVRKIK